MGSEAEQYNDRARNDRIEGRERWKVSFYNREEDNR